jgi:dUTP pyrophosphatase
MAVKLKVKRLHPDAVIPTYGSKEAAGFDLTVIEDVVINPGGTYLARTGLAFDIPSGYEIQIRPRSGASLNTKVRIANAPGTIDSDYTGEVKLILDNIAENGTGWFYNDQNSVVIPAGTRIAQGVLAPILQAEFEVVEELKQTERGASGFGSTGDMNGSETSKKDAGISERQRERVKGNDTDIKVSSDTTTEGNKGFKV